MAGPLFYPKLGTIANRSTIARYCRTTDQSALLLVKKRRLLSGASLLPVCVSAVGWALPPVCSSTVGWALLPVCSSTVGWALLPVRSSTVGWALPPVCFSTPSKTRARVPKLRRVSGKSAQATSRLGRECPSYCMHSDSRDSVGLAPCLLLWKQHVVHQEYANQTNQCTTGRQQTKVLQRSRVL